MWMAAEKHDIRQQIQRISRLFASYIGHSHGEMSELPGRPDFSIVVAAQARHAARYWALTLLMGYILRRVGGCDGWRQTPSIAFWQVSLASYWTFEMAKREKIFCGGIKKLLNRRARCSSLL